MKKLLSFIAGLLLLSTTFAQVCPVSLSLVKPRWAGKMLQTIRTFEPCDTYAAQIALMVAIWITKQQYPAAIFLSGNTLQNNRARWQSHWATKHMYSVQ